VAPQQRHQRVEVQDNAAMALLSLSNAHLAYGHVALLDATGLALEPGERLGLIGRNGAGKSSLLKVVAGLEKLDDGLLQMTQGLRICYVPQEPVFEPGHTCSTR
jgi:ATP-binding cassette subfamily F protein uup